MSRMLLINHSRRTLVAAAFLFLPLTSPARAAEGSVPAPEGGTAGTVTLTKSIASSADDAGESSAGTVSLTGSGIAMTGEPGSDAGNKIAGLRFTGITIPPGATVTNATIQFKSGEPQSTPATLNIAAELDDNSPAFAAAERNLSSRLPSTGVLWQPAAWNSAGESAGAQRTPNLAAAVQEVVSRPGWASGNALSFLITGTGRRTAEAFDKSGAVPAVLTLTYSTAPSVTFTQWLQNHPALTGPAAALNADPDGDNVKNILEYALRTNPSQADMFPHTVTRDGDSVILQYSRPSAAPRLIFIVESSRAIAAGWSNTGITQQVLSDDGTTRTMRATIPSFSPRTFVRLKVTLLP